MTRGLAASSALVLVFVTGGDVASAPDPIKAATVLAIGAWASAVRSHKPGLRDAASAGIVSLTFEKRVELNDGMALFLSALLGERVVTNTDPRKAIALLGREISQNAGANDFLRRAAVLHSDTAIDGDRGDSPPSPAPPGTTMPGTSTSPLLFRHPLFLDRDGEVVGEVSANWNWPFARSLLDLIAPRPADDPFVGTWYHATTAFMLQGGHYGEAFAHLARAAEVLPDDARLLFDRASYAELQGLPVSQVLLSDEDLLALRAQRSGRRLPGGTGSWRATQLGIPPVEVTNGEAERLYRRALHINPSFVEARVRLARLLTERRHYDEAALELKMALEAKPAGIVAFYAHLFAGRAAQALGHIDEAAEHYREASTLFPGAQSALLAQSQAALLGGDVAAALVAIERLDRSSSAKDPWWKYSMGAGRDTEALLREMWSAVTH